MLDTSIPSSPYRNNHGDLFSDLQLQLNFPQQQIATERGDSITEGDYYCQVQGIASTDFYEGRVLGKKWSALTVACIDLTCSSLFIIQEGRKFIDVIAQGDGSFLISAVASSVILSFFWFLSGWKLMEASYFKRQLIDRYQMARFWRVTNITLLIVFILASILIILCLHGNCETGISNDVIKFLPSVGFRALFFVGVVFVCAQRTISIWVIHKYINEIRSELSTDSFPLEVLSGNANTNTIDQYNL